MKAPTTCAYCRRRIDSREGFIFLVRRPVPSPDSEQLKRLIHAGRMLEKVSALSVAACQQCGQGRRPMPLLEASMGEWGLARDSAPREAAGGERCPQCWEPAQRLLWGVFYNDKECGDWFWWCEVCAARSSRAALPEPMPAPAPAPLEVDEVIAHIMLAEEKGQRRTPEEWARQFPGFEREIRGFLSNAGVLAVDGPLDPLLPSVDVAALRDDGFKVGDLINTEYRVFAIREGGMGRVYLVDMLDKESRGLRVAIKTLKSPKADEPDSAGQSAIFIAERNRHYALVKERFRSESATWMELGAHPNIVIALHVLDVRGLPHLLMEYVGGGSLGDWIASGRTWTCAALAVNFATQICHGMRHAAKKNGLVHRDLKPANILVREDGTVKVTDFGLSRAYEVNEKPTVGGDAVTTMSMAGGTRLYMAPEQFAGRADTRSDVFSFGAILYEMLTGRRLFAGSERPKPLDTSALAQFKVHSELIAVVQRCLCHSPAERFQSFDEVERELRRVSQFLPPPWERVWMPLLDHFSGTHQELLELARLPVLPMLESRILDAWADSEAVNENTQTKAQASSLIAIGRFTDALKVADAGIERFPEDAGHWINRATALAHLGQSDESHRSILRAVQLEPSNGLALSNLAHSHLSRKEPNDALRRAEEAMRAAPELPESWWGKGKALAAHGRFREAAESIRHAISLRPDDIRGHYFLTETLQEAEWFEEAEAAANAGLALDAEHTELWMLLSLNLYYQSRLKEAVAAAEKVIAIKPKDARSWGFYLATMFESGAEDDEVDRYLDRAETMGAEIPAIMQIRPKIDQMRRDRNPGAANWSKNDWASSLRWLEGLTPEAFAAKCLTQPDREKEESRSAENCSFLRELVEHLNAGKNDLTVSMAERLIEAHPDLDILYSWQSSAHLRAGRIKSAIAAVERGVERALRKRYVLCALAEASLQQRDLRAAVYAWSQCILCQRGTHEAYTPFLYLSYVARYSGARRAEEAAELLLAKSDALRVGAIRLDDAFHRQYKYITKLSSDAAIRAFVDQIPGSPLFAG